MGYKVLDQIIHIPWQVNVTGSWLQNTDLGHFGVPLSTTIIEQQIQTDKGTYLIELKRHGTYEQCKWSIK
jgi:hypothetical protein